LSLFCASRPCGFNASWQRSPWYWRSVPTLAQPSMVPGMRKDTKT
jgi:hypothetical protein